MRNVTFWVNVTFSVVNVTSTFSVVNVLFFSGKDYIFDSEIGVGSHNQEIKYCLAVENVIFTTAEHNILSFII